MHLRFNFDACPMHSPFRFVHLMHQNLSALALFCQNSLAKVNMQLLIYEYICSVNDIWYSYLLQKWNFLFWEWYEILCLIVQNKLSRSNSSSSQSNYGKYLFCKWHLIFILPSKVDTLLFWKRHQNFLTLTWPLVTGHLQYQPNAYVHKQLSYGNKPKDQWRLFVKPYNPTLKPVKWVTL